MDLHANEQLVHLADVRLESGPEGLEDALADLRPEAAATCPGALESYS